jgi:hypothetical protein
MEGSPCIAELFTHIHFVRLVFVFEDAPEFAGDLAEKEWVDEPDPGRIAQMLNHSAKAVRDAVKSRVEAGRDMDLHYDHPILLLQRMLWHDGYHHGQIKLALKLAGHPWRATQGPMRRPDRSRGMSGCARPERSWGSLCGSCSPLVFVALHVYLFPAKRYAFSLQAKALLKRRLSLQLDRASRPKHALPRHSQRSVQRPCHQASSASKSRGGSNCAVSTHLAVRNLRNRTQNSSLHSLARDLRSFAPVGQPRAAVPTWLPMWLPARSYPLRLFAHTTQFSTAAAILSSHPSRIIRSLHELPGPSP